MSNAQKMQNFVSYMVSHDKNISFGKNFLMVRSCLFDIRLITKIHEKENSVQMMKIFEDGHDNLQHVEICYSYVWS